MASRLLFILKRREDYSQPHHSNVGLSTGLYNSASFVNQMMIDAGVESKMVVVADNNCIDREVTAYRPTHVIIEALWVVPTKFAVLCKLHPSVTWIIRLHSEMPFLANEGIAMDWIADYVRFPNVIIGVNAPRMMSEVRFYLQTVFGWPQSITEDRIIYLPNSYPRATHRKKFDISNREINIGCFGAIRPLKNHMIQAIAAVKLAESMNMRLNFHVNAGRLEMKGEPVLHNLRGFFQQLYDRGHKMISHTWCPREDFLKICAQMDIGMQVSFSETFNIVGADLISQGVPMVMSSEVPWVSSLFCADPTNTDDIFYILERTVKWPALNVWRHQRLLNSYTSETLTHWLRYFKQS